MKLTKNDQIILDSYTNTIEGLAEYLGEGCEVILYLVDGIDNPIKKISNGYHSNKEIGTPMPCNIKSILKRFQSDVTIKKKSSISHYEANEQIKSIAIPISNSKNNIIGLLCINFYMQTPLASVLSLFTPQQEPTPIKAESFPSNTDYLILTAVENARAKVFYDNTITYINKNKEILNILYNNGIFSLKDSVSKVAKLLGLSKNTVYLHLRNLSQEK